jgi:hypothetical protein
VLHELGMREDAVLLLEAIKNQISGDSLNSQVVRRYIAQETQEREEVHFSAKKLNTMAVEHFQKNRFLPALNTVEQALKINPDNVKLLFSQLKILMKIKQEGLDEPEHITLVDNIFAKLTSLNLEGKSATVFADLATKWQQLNV